MLPKDFTGTTLGQEPDAYVPLSFKPLLTPNWNGTDRYDDYWLYLVGRLKPGTTRAAGGRGLEQHVPLDCGGARQDGEVPRPESHRSATANRA